MLTGATEDARRTAVFARYSLVGALAAAAGALAAAGPDALAAAGVPRRRVRSLHLLWWVTEVALVINLLTYVHWFLAVLAVLAAAYVPVSWATCDGLLADVEAAGSDADFY